MTHLFGREKPILTVKRVIERCGMTWRPFRAKFHPPWHAGARFFCFLTLGGAYRAHSLPRWRRGAMSQKRPPRPKATPPKPFTSRDSLESRRTTAAFTSSPDKEPSVCPPGRAIFAVVVPPTELEPEDKRYALPRRAFGAQRCERASRVRRTAPMRSREPFPGSRRSRRVQTRDVWFPGFSFEARAAFSDPTPGRFCACADALLSLLFPPLLET